MGLKFVANTVLRKIKKMNKNRILNTGRKIRVKKAVIKDKNKKKTAQRAWTPGRFC